MKLAVVAGGWHYPHHFYRSMAQQASGADLFCIGHRSPDCYEVATEKQDKLRGLEGKLGELDRELYADYATTLKLKHLGWTYELHANTCGDWGFLNQWLKSHDWSRYEVILFAHDDTYLRPEAFPPDIGMGDWLVLGHSRYPQAPLGYLRGSLEFFKRELIELLGGEIPLGDVTLTREGKTDSPVRFDALSAWNATCDPLREFMRRRNLVSRIAYISEHYRISPWCIEGERGLLSNQGGAPWSYEAGLQAYPI